MDLGFFGTLPSGYFGRKKPNPRDLGIVTPKKSHPKPTSGVKKRSLTVILFETKSAQGFYNFHGIVCVPTLGVGASVFRFSRTINDFDTLLDNLNIKRAGEPTQPHQLEIHFYLQFNKPSNHGGHIYFEKKCLTGFFVRYDGFAENKNFN